MSILKVMETESTSLVSLVFRNTHLRYFDLSLLFQLTASEGDEIAPRTSQPIAAIGGSVQALTLKLLTTNTMIAAIPPPSRGRFLTSMCAQLHKACQRGNATRATKTMSTGRPAI